MTGLRGAPPRISASSSRCDQGGRLDGVQVIVHKGHAFIGHMFSDGFSVIDVRDPRKPKTVAFVAAPKNTRSHHLQIHGDICSPSTAPMSGRCRNMPARTTITPSRWPKSFKSERAVRRRRARLRHLQPGQPARDRLSATSPGFGAHRIWWVGGRYAYVSVHFEGFIDHIAGGDRRRRSRASPKLAGHWWLPGMNRGGGEKPRAPKGKRYGAASHDHRRQSRLWRLARRRLHRARRQRSGAIRS